MALLTQLEQRRQAAETTAAKARAKAMETYRAILFREATGKTEPGDVAALEDVIVVLELSPEAVGRDLEIVKESLAMTALAATYTEREAERERTSQALSDLQSRQKQEMNAAILRNAAAAGAAADAHEAKTKLIALRERHPNLFAPPLP